MTAKLAIGILAAVVVLFVLALLLRRRPAAQPERTLSIEEVRTRLELAKSRGYSGGDSAELDGSIDAFVKLLRERYGERVRPVDVMKTLHSLSSAPPFPAADIISILRDPHVVPPASEVAAASGAGASGLAGRKPPNGVQVTPTPAGFEIRISQGNPFLALMWLVFAAVLIMLPFKAVPDEMDIVRTGGLTTTSGILLSIWAAGILVLLGMAVFGAVGEVRVLKEGDDGVIFTGVGRIGRSQHLHWSELYGVSDKEVSIDTGSKYNRTNHFVGLNGKARSYQFGSQFDDRQRVYVVAFLRKEVFRAETPAPGVTVSADGKTVSMAQIRQAVEEAKLNYAGRDPEGFRQAADQLLASLRTQYGDQVPVADAEPLLRKLAHDSGAAIHFNF